MKAIIITIIAFIIYACTDQKGQLTTSYIENKSGHVVEFMFYKEGVFDESYSKKFLVGEKVLVFRDDDFGAGLSYPLSLDLCDSVLVLFDNNKVSTHYDYGVVGNNPNAILFTNSRNLFNENNYENKIIRDTKRDFEQEFLYTITEQDFIDAVSN